MFFIFYLRFLFFNTINFFFYKFFYFIKIFFNSWLINIYFVSLIYLIIVFTIFFGFIPYFYYYFSVFILVFLYCFIFWLDSLFFILIKFNYFFLKIERNILILNLLLLLVEIVGEMVRPFALRIRLLVNVWVGILLCIFFFYLGNFFLSFFIIFIEIFVFFVQSFIFCSLISVYMLE